VLVAAGDHKDLIAGRPVVAGKDIGREVGANDLADVQGSVGVGPGDTQEHALFLLRAGHNYRKDCSIAGEPGARLADR